MKVLGTELYDKGIQNAVDEFLDLAQTTPKNLLVSPSDANVLVLAKKNIEFSSVLRQYFWNLPDGVPSVWVLKLKGAKKANRCSGPDFFEQIIKASKDLSINHFLCGGADGISEKLKLQCVKWGNNNIVGTNTPPFKTFTNEDFQALATKIKASKADIIWIGLGAPKQIYFSAELAKYVTVNFIVPIGAAFDFHSGNIKKAPQWIQNIGLEWFYRMLIELKTN